MPLTHPLVGLVDIAIDFSRTVWCCWLAAGFRRLLVNVLPVLQKMSVKGNFQRPLADSRVAWTMFRVSGVRYKLFGKELDRLSLSVQFGSNDWSVAPLLVIQF